MRLRDEKKRRIIVETATKLFSENPFPKVHLDTVAAAAGIGKGTIYIYFKSKEDLYYSLVYDGLSDVVRQLRAELVDKTSKGQDHGSGLSDEPATDFNEKIRVIVTSVVDFALRYPQLFEVMRHAGVPDASSQWDTKRRELNQLVEDVIQEGVEAGQLEDARPDLTALYLSAMVRAVMLYNPQSVDRKTLIEHMMNLFERGIVKLSGVFKLT